MPTWEPDDVVRTLRHLVGSGPDAPVRPVDAGSLLRVVAAGVSQHRRLYDAVLLTPAGTDHPDRVTVAAVSGSAVAAEPGVLVWTAADQSRAEAFGWGIFRRAEPAEPGLDAYSLVATRADVLLSDQAAWECVWDQAAGGVDVATRALQFLFHRAPAEYARVRASACP